jgi:hypothetical protein
MNRDQLVKEARTLRTKLTDESYRWRSYPWTYARYMDIIGRAEQRILRRMDLPK